MADKKSATEENKGGEMPSNDMIPLHARLRMGQPVQTGAGKGPFGGDKGPKTPA